MSSMDQNAVDALLSQVQNQADQLNQEVGSAGSAVGGGAPGAAEPALDQVSAAISEIAGEIDGPPAKNGGMPLEGHDGLAGEFAAPSAVAGGAVPASEVKRLMAIEVPVIVQLGCRRMKVGEVMRLAVGAIVEFSKSAEEELELLVNNKAVGKGQAVKVGENFGIKITGIGSVKEVIRTLGGA